MTPQTPSLPHWHRRGFTLIELLVVIGIIAVLVGLLVTGIPRVRRAAAGASTSAQLSTLAAAIQAYHSDFSAYPGPLANNQVGMQYHGTPAPNNTLSVMVLNTLRPMAALPNNQRAFITGSENLVLGLLGGLRLNVDSVSGTVLFDYDSTRIFSDPVTPAPKGAMGMNWTRPQNKPAYLQVRPGDISHPDLSVSNGAFVDAARRVAQDSSIPEFVDQYSEGLPILYMRANPGATAIAGLGGRDDAGAFLDPNLPNVPVTPQYDIAGIVQYIYDDPAGTPPSGIGTKANDSYLRHHGLQGLGDNNLGDTIDGAWKLNQKNALAYLKDPHSPGARNFQGNPRQKDGYILISAGPDRCYGTTDDIIYPGSLNP